MSTFLQLASLGTLVAGLLLVTPVRVSASVINNHFSDFSSGVKSNQVLPIDNNYSPPNNGGPKTGNQGSGTR